MTVILAFQENQSHKNNSLPPPSPTFFDHRFVFLEKMSWITHTTHTPALPTLLSKGRLALGIPLMVNKKRSHRGVLNEHDGTRESTHVEQGGHRDQDRAPGVQHARSWKHILRTWHPHSKENIYHREQYAHGLRDAQGEQDAQREQDAGHSPCLLTFSFLPQRIPTKHSTH